MGKASKKRSCPAINQTISRADCGQNRHTRYPCPPECPYNPLAPDHYDQLLEIESHLDRKTVERMPADFARPVHRLPGGQSLVLSSPFEAGQARAIWKLFHEADASGRTWAQGWEAEDFEKLKNDEITILRAKMRSRIALLEIRRVIDGQTVEAIDLLDPDGTVIPIVDRSTAAQAVRFVTYLGWIYPTPHFWKLTGSAIEISEQGPLQPVDVVREVVRYHGGNDAIPEMETWIAENYALVCETLLATAHERRRQMLSGLDLMMGEVEYTLNARYAKCRKRLDSSPFTDRAEVEDGELEEGFAEIRTWFAEPQTKKKTDDSGPRKMLGCVLLGQEKWRLEASSGARLTRLRTDFEKLMSDLVRFKSEKRDDTASQFAMREPEGDLSLIPPRLLEHPDQLGIEQSRIDVPSSGDDPGAAILKHALSNWADQPVPALDGFTPREAVNDLLLRSRVISLVKSQVTTVDRRNLREGRTDDINGLIRDLGLHEIDEPPPPMRPVPEDRLPDRPTELPGGSWEPNEQVELLTMQGIVDHVLEPDEAESRFESAFEYFSAYQNEGAGVESWVLDIVDNLAEITEGLLPEREFDLLIPLVVLACHTLVPPGARPPPFSQTRLESAVVGSVKKTPSWMAMDHERFVEEVTAKRRQPALVTLLVAHFLSSLEDSIKDRSFEPTSAIFIIAIATSVMDELDRAIRG